MYLPKENSTPGEKWVNDTQRIGAGMENSICSDPELFVVWCLIPSLDPLLVVVV